MTGRPALCAVLALACSRGEAPARADAAADTAAAPVPPAPVTFIGTPLAEDSVIRPAAADSVLVAQLRASRDSLDRRLRRDSTLGTDRYLRIAMFEDSSLSPLEDADRWSDTTLVNLGVLLDARGRVRLVHELPVSLTGDWFNAHTHYFDATGRLFAYERDSRFAAGCAVPARETVVTYADTAGRIVSREYTLAATGRAAAVATATCTFPFRWPYTIHRTWEWWASAAGVEALVPPAGAATDSSVTPFETPGGAGTVSAYRLAGSLLRLVARFDGDGASWVAEYQYRSDTLLSAYRRWDRYPDEGESRYSEDRWTFARGRPLRWRRREEDGTRRTVPAADSAFSREARAALEAAACWRRVAESRGEAGAC